jgi:hypothetical protein
VLVTSRRSSSTADLSHPFEAVPIALASLTHGSYRQRVAADGRPEDLRTKVYGERTVYDNPWVRVVVVDIEPPDGIVSSTTLYVYRPLSWWLPLMIMTEC